VTTLNTSVTEIADKIYRLSTYVEQAELRFNQYLIDAEQPLVFHCGYNRLFPLVSTAAARVVPLKRIRWISFGHVEADECASLNSWLEAAPQSQVAVGEIGCMVSVADLASREPKALQDGEVLDLGGKRVRYVYTPHVPHGWDAGLLFEETTRTLLCGDLFSQSGDSEAITNADIVGPASKTEDLYQATVLTSTTAPTIRKLAELSPTTLGLMHGPAFHGNGKQALLDLADDYEKRFKNSIGL
jgi:flavorubredoxin